MDSLEELARVVRRRRKALGITQIALSELAGCGPAFIYDVERGKATLRLDKLLDVLDGSPGWRWWPGRTVAPSWHP